MFSRPKKMNSITPEMYEELTDALNTASNNKTYATVITGKTMLTIFFGDTVAKSYMGVDHQPLLLLVGTGKHFSAGNDLSNAAK